MRAHASIAKLAATLLGAFLLAPAASASAAAGQLYGFGENAAGQLASTAGNGGEAPNPTPALLALPGATGPVVETAAGARFTLALTSSGQLYAFGSNQYGQLGVAAGSGAPGANPTPRLVSLPGAVGRIAQLAAGSTHSLALTTTGELYTFGENQLGQLGRSANLGTQAANRTPERIGLPGASGQVVQIAAANEQSLALTSTGQLYAFGGNRYGELGRAANVETPAPNPTPAPVGLPAAAGPVTSVAAGGFHSLALTVNGLIYAFGRNTDGQIGTAANTGGEKANATPVAVPLPGANAPAIGLAAGSAHTLAITASGELYAFGSNLEGQLGSATNSGTTSANPMPARVALPPGTTIDAVARGATADFTIAQVADLAVLSSSLAFGQVGVPYVSYAAAAGGVGGYTWSAGGLPAGLSIDPTSGQISGTPAAAGTSAVVLHVADAFGVNATSATILLTIAPATPTRAFLSTTLTDAQLRQSLRQQLGMRGRSVRIASLRKRRRYSYGFTALTPGALAISWYWLPPGARLSRAAPVLFAAGRVTYRTAGTKTAVLTLTNRGRKLLRHRRRITLTAKGSFTPTGRPTIAATKAFSIAR